MEYYPAVIIFLLIQLLSVCVLFYGYKLNEYLIIPYFHKNRWASKVLQKHQRIVIGRELVLSAMETVDREKLLQPSLIRAMVVTYIILKIT